MLSKWVRVLHDDNGTITDYSLASNDRTSVVTLPIVSGEDYLYIGQYFPFNNLYFNLDTANSNASSVEVSYWNGSSWVAAVDILDETNDGGKSMAQSGVIQWEIDRDETSWNKVNDPTDEEAALGFNDLKIYDLYWVRIGFSADLSSGSDIKQIAYKFCSDNDVKALSPDINDYLTSWASGKTDWVEQIIEASKQVVQDLKSRGIIRHSGQILRFDEINVPCAYKSLSIIYDGIGGEDFLEMRNEKDDKYKSLIGKIPLTIDTNNNAKVDDIEKIGLPQNGVWR